MSHSLDILHQTTSICTVNESSCKLCGSCSLMTSSLMLTNEVILSIAKMVSSTVPFFVSSYMQPIILKSKCDVHTTVLISYDHHRILLACIKFLGACPCPHCLVLKANIIQMGLESDMVTRQTNIWHGNQELTRKVKKAWKLIIQSRATINGTRVQRILQSESLVPTHVCANLLCY